MTDEFFELISGPLRLFTHPTHHAQRDKGGTMQRTQLLFAAILAVSTFLALGCQPSADTIATKAAQAEAVVSPPSLDSATPLAKDDSPMSEPNSSRPTPAHEMVFEEEPFGTLPDGRPVTLYTCGNATGLTLKMIDYGATVIAVENRDRKRVRANITLGFNDLEGYLQNSPYFGATVACYGAPNESRRLIRSA